MANLQVKNLPAELHAQLRERAAEQGQSVSEYVTRLLRQDLRRPSMAQWLAARSGGEPRPEVDAVALVEALRVERG